MFGTELLDVAIGLAFTYIVLSLVASAVLEAAESLLRTRSKYLWQGIGELLDTPAPLRNMGSLREMVTRTKNQRPSRDQAEATAADAPAADAPPTLRSVYEHPLISGLYYGDYDQASSRLAFRTLPSYIPRSNFAAAVIDLVSQPHRGDGISTIEALRRGVGGLAEGKTKRALSAIVALAGDDLASVERALEVWYDSAMDRVAGWYKRHAQVLLLAIGYAVALSLNANSIALAHYLASEESARDAFVQAADQFMQNRTVEDLKANGAVDTYLKQISDRGSPIGKAVPWADPMLYLGCLITAFAISLGAPFWFDLLNKLMVIRSTVKPKEKSADEGSEDRPSTPAGPANGRRPSSFVQTP
jgi:hypothetical protein